MVDSRILIARLLQAVCVCYLSLIFIPRAAMATDSRPDAANSPDSRARSILQTRCVSCHGAIAQSGLRLDSREGILKGGKRGAAVIPGKPEQSLIVKAIRHDGDLKMPPTGKLADEDIAVITEWVKAANLWNDPSASQGAAAEETHWSFRPVKRPVIPTLIDSSWVRNPIDAYILAELQKQKLRPSREVDRRTLIRRISLDLIGLPPTTEDVDAFLRDRSRNAWDRVVERLLGSPHFGERMALLWLDLGRYADSDGYHDDTERFMWRYRDYVISSLNSNKPFDRFTIEQLAGDLLIGSTTEQKIASAFNRLGPTSSEGGAIPEEYLAKYAVDRVTTTMNVWQGLTIQCTECHDHKYDPLKTKEFYQLFAYFNQVPENALYRGNDAPPTILLATAEQQAKMDELDKLIASLEEDAKPRTAATSATSSGTTNVDPKAEEARIAEVTKKLNEVKDKRSQVERQARLRIMEDGPERRQTFVLIRGDYRNHGEKVMPGVPAAVGSLPKGASPNRLSLAYWLVSHDNPLTARVTVNRLWEMIFGMGLVKSSDDFGTRGEKPSHPELLDWLASEFMRSGWDVKHIIRLIVTSSTYRQSSRITPALHVRDPQNRLLARGPRFRLTAELIRDNALAISGLLDRNRPVGGPSVKPYQPGDLWRELSAGDDATKSYVQDHGADLYRRGLYTYWKRSILYPAFAVFDAPKRETCILKRPITNTPLQAFVTLNDVAYLEAARVFAQQLMQEGGATTESRIQFAYLRALARRASSRETKALIDLHDAMLDEYRKNTEGAKKLVNVGEAPRRDDLDVSELAAWTCVCNAILNLDETITKE